MKFLRIWFASCLVSWVYGQSRSLTLPEIERPEVLIFPVGPGTAFRDPLLLSLGNPQTMDQAVQQYRQLGREAVPGLINHLQDPQPGIRLLALSALQFAWSPEAEDPVRNCLFSHNNSEAKAAWYLLKQKTDAAALEKWAEENLLQLNPGRVSDILDRIESKNPDPARMMQLLQMPKYWRAALPYLPRYTDPAFTPLTRRIVGKTQGELRALALAALIHQADRDGAVLDQVGALLQDEHAAVREMAAEYLRWHGRKSDLGILDAASVDETDLFAKASLSEAMRILEIREDTLFPVNRQAIEPAVNYAEGISGLPGSSVLETVTALRTATGYAAPNSRQMTEPPPWVLVPPTRSFLSERGNDFGVKVKATDGPFADSVHVAQDVSWGEVMASVVAVAPGTVKLVRMAAESWGGLVVIEHQSPRGKTFCSLYGHLGPLITVQPGDQIAAGSKIGSLGRSYTAENGGYECHLHFGIYNQAYGTGRWVTGYMDKEKFFQQPHHWIDPYTLYGEK